MRQDPSLKSAKSSAPQGLHPILQAALNSLDAQLEEELTRYRRQQAGRPLPPRAITRQQTRKPLDLISVGATGGRTQPQAPKATTPPSPSSAASVDSTYHAPTQPAVPPPNHPGLEQAVHNDSLNGSSSLAIATRPTELDQESENSANSNETASLTATAVESDVWGQLINPEPTHPGDYLESSEELLRSLAEEEAKVRAERGFVDSLLTPVGVGSMLLLLLSSATFGYVIMNPSSLSSLGFNRLFNDSKPTTAQAPTGTTSAANGAGPGIPNAPNLASQEFKDLSLGSLSTLPTSPSGSAASTQKALPNLKGSAAKPANGAVPSSTVPGKLSTLTTTLPAALTSPTTANAGGQSAAASAPSTRSMSITPPPAPARIYPPPTVTRVAPPPARSYSPPPTRSYTPPARSYSPPPAVERPAPAPEPPSVSPDVSVPEPVANSPTPAQGDYYHVVTDYNSDRALEQARQVVPDAYVRNFPEGAQVQLGAFNDAQKAQSLVQELQDKGIPAQVQQR